MSVLKVKNGNDWVATLTGGVGVPSGGTQGQVLTKSSGVDYATQWSTVESSSMPSVHSITLTSTDWTGNGPYTQSISIAGATANSKVDIQPDAVAIQQMINDGVVAMYIENNVGTLTAYAIGKKPTISITVQVTVTEVS